MLHRMCVSMYFPEFISNLSQMTNSSGPNRVHGRRPALGDGGGSLSLGYFSVSLSLPLSLFAVRLFPSGWGERRDCRLMSEREPSREQNEGERE